MAVTNYYVKVELDPCDVSNGDKLVIYDSSSSEFKLIDKNDREGNICYEGNNGPGFKELTITLDPSTFPEGVSGSFNYAKIECDAVTAGTYTQHQSIRTILIWDSASDGGEMVASTIEEARYPDNKVIHDIKRTTASFDDSGSLVFKTYQYSVNDITYCLKYSLL